MTQVTWVSEYATRWTYLEGNLEETARLAVERAKMEGFKGPFTVWVYESDHVNTTRDTPTLVVSL